MSAKVRRVVLATMLLATSGCSDFREIAGLRSKAPDEFRVISHAPLAMPPEFTLRPPVPGAKRPQEPDERQDAKSIIYDTPMTEDTEMAASSDAIFLQKAGANNANPLIKELLNQEELDAAKEQEKKNIFEKAIAYTGLSKDKAKASDPAINAALEKKRLENPQKIGQLLDKTATAKTKTRKGALLNPVFGF